MSTAKLPALSESRRMLLLSLVLGVVTMAVFWPAQDHEFLNYDDPAFTYENEHVARGLTWDGVVWAFTTGHTGYQLPLTWLSLMLDVTLFGMQPGGFLFTNILLHAANSILLFLLMRRLAGGWLAPFFVAAVFAWHPTHVESVAWIAERKDVLSWFFALLAMQGYASWTARPRLWRYAVFVLLPFTLALLAKPMLVVLPVLLLAFDIWPLNRLEPWPAAWGRSAWADWLKQCGVRFAEKAPMLLISLGYGLLAVNIAESRSVNAPWDQFPLYARLVHMVDAYGMYVRNFFLPFDLCILHIHPRRFYPWHETALSGLVLAGFTLLAIGLFRFHRAALAGWLWFGASLFLVSGLFQNGTQIIANRYTYIAYIGLAAAVAYPLAAWASRRGGLRSGFSHAAAFGACAAMLFGSGQQLRTFRHSVALWDHAILCVPDNAIALGNLSPALVGLVPGGRHAGLREALAKSLRAVELLPIDINPTSNAGHYAWLLGKRAMAIPLLQRAILLGPKNATPFLLLAQHATEAGEYEQAYRLMQEAAVDFSGKGFARLNLARAAENAGRFQEAESVLRQMVAEYPGSAVIRARLALFLASVRDSAFRKPDEALELAKAASQLAATSDPLTDVERRGVDAALAAGLSANAGSEEAVRIASPALQRAKQEQNQFYSTLLEDILEAATASQPFINGIYLPKKGSIDGDGSSVSQ